MGGATTRGRKKATAAESDEPPVEAPEPQWRELQSRVGQLTVSLAVAEEKRVAFEAETRQALTEVRFELRNLQQKHYRETQALQEKCQDLQMKNVACTSTVAALERSIERVLDRVVSSDRSDTMSHADGSRIEQQHSVDDVPPGPGRSDVHLAAEDRMSELDDMRSEVSASTAAYCHSSLDSVRRALAKTRR